ncbi:MAG: hypothetical protein PHI97_27360 [Desulfobulbus sp.]|nr:hypothetical protein [Desulfobulbus sp.]
MNKNQLLNKIKKIQPGTHIPGLTPEKVYYFKGCEEYKGRGEFRDLTGQTVVLIKSPDRKRSIVRLFIEPIFLFINSKENVLGYGCHPVLKFNEVLYKPRPKFPNLFEFSVHYNAFCLFLKNL